MMHRCMLIKRNRKLTLKLFLPQGAVIQHVHNQQRLDPVQLPQGVLQLHGDQLLLGVLLLLPQKKFCVILV